MSKLEQLIRERDELDLRLSDEEVRLDNIRGKIRELDKQIESKEKPFSVGTGGDS